MEQREFLISQISSLKSLIELSGDDGFVSIGLKNRIKMLEKELESFNATKDIDWIKSKMTLAIKDSESILKSAQIESNIILRKNFLVCFDFLFKKYPTINSISWKNYQIPYEDWQLCSLFEDVVKINGSNEILSITPYRLKFSESEEDLIEHKEIWDLGYDKELFNDEDYPDLIENPKIGDLVLVKNKNHNEEYVKFLMDIQTSFQDVSSEQVSDMFEAKYNQITIYSNGNYEVVPLDEDSWEESF